MNNKQLAAARKAAMAFPQIGIEKRTDGETSTLTPYLLADASMRGDPVSVIANVTQTDSVTRALSLSCAVLAG